MKPLRLPFRTVAIAVLTFAAFTSAQAQRPAPPELGAGPWDIQTEKGPIHVTVHTRGLESPWSLVFLPGDGNDMLLTERSGRLRVFRDGKLDPEPISGLPPMVITGISGLFGLALHPNFASNRLIYFAYPKANPKNEEELALAVARARWDGGQSLSNVEEIFVASGWYSPAMAEVNNRCCGQGPSTGSFGARIDFGPDGKLYVSSGDRNWGEMSQNPASDIGKILRINDDGTVPADNPFVGRAGYLPEIYTLGHRNPTGLRFDRATGDLWETEFGPRGGEELNRIVAGGNYGWILVTQGTHYNDTKGELGAKNVPGYIDPVVAWPPSGNPGNVIRYRGNLFPQWKGDIFVAAMSRPGALVRVPLDAKGNAMQEERLLTELGQRYRDVVEGPDGRIWVLTEASAFPSPGAVLVLEPGK